MIALKEIISVLALLASVGAALALAFQTGREARRSWGLPIPGIRRQVPGTNGRWKLDWGIVFVFWTMALRDTWVGLVILAHRPTLSPVTVALYLLTAFAKCLVFHLLVHDRRHIASREKETPHA